MKPVRILLVDTGKEWGGGTNSMIELLKRIDRERFSITALFYINYPKGIDLDLRSELDRIGTSLKLLTPLRQPRWAKVAKELARVFAFWSRGVQKFIIFKIELAWRIRPTARRIAAIIQEGGYHLLYLNNQPSSNLEGYLAAGQTAIPLVQHARIVARLNRAEVELINRYASRIICVSQGVCDDLLRQAIAPEKCIVVYNGIDTRQALVKEFRGAPAGSGSTDRPVKIGTVGQLAVRKFTEHLLEAAAILRSRKTRPFSVQVIGAGPRDKFLELRTKELDLTAIVSFAGFLANPFAAMADFDIFVLTSSTEGFPRVILEAMMLGKPVVASRIVGAEELVRDGTTGLLYEFGNIKSLAEKLQCLVENVELRQRMGHNGQEVVTKDYSIERYVAGVERVLMDVVEENKCFT
ncbi:MAG: glycosyltransferase [Burkholderiales bacterium]